MAWTATVVTQPPIKRENGWVQIVVRFTSDTGETVDEAFRARNPQPGWLSGQVRRCIDDLTASDAELASITAGPINPPAEPAPPPEAADRVEYRTRLNELRALHNFVDLGIIDLTENIWTSRVAWLRANRKPGFFDL